MQENQFNETLLNVDDQRDMILGAENFNVNARFKGTIYAKIIDSSTVARDVSIASYNFNAWGSYGGTVTRTVNSASLIPGDKTLHTEDASCTIIFYTSGSFTLIQSGASVVTSNDVSANVTTTSNLFVLSADTSTGAYPVKFDYCASNADVSIGWKPTSTSSVQNVHAVNSAGSYSSTSSIGYYYGGSTPVIFTKDASSHTIYNGTAYSGQISDGTTPYGHGSTIHTNDTVNSIPSRNLLEFEDIELARININFYNECNTLAASNYKYDPKIKLYLFGLFNKVTFNVATSYDSYFNEFASWTTESASGGRKFDAYPPVLGSISDYITIQYKKNPGNFSHDFSMYSSDNAIKLLYTKFGADSEDDNFPDKTYNINDSNLYVGLINGMGLGEAWPPTEDTYWYSGTDDLYSKENTIRVLAESFIYIDRDNVNTNSSVYFYLNNNSINNSFNGGFTFNSSYGINDKDVELFEYKKNNIFDNTTTNPSIVPDLFDMLFGGEYYYCPHVTGTFNYTANIGEDGPIVLTRDSSYVTTQIPIGLYADTTAKRHIKYINNYAQYYTPVVDANVSVLSMWLRNDNVDIAKSSVGNYTISLKVSDILATDKVFDSPYMKSYAVYTEMRSPNYSTATGIKKPFCYIVHFIIGGHTAYSNKAMRLVYATGTLMTSSDLPEDAYRTTYDIDEYFSFANLNSYWGHASDYYHAYENDFSNNTGDKWSNLITPHQLFSSTIWAFPFYNADYEIGDYGQYQFDNIVAIDYLTGKPINAISIAENIMRNYNSAITDVTNSGEHSDIWQGMIAGYWNDFAYTLASDLFGEANAEKVINERQYLIYALRQAPVRPATPGSEQDMSYYDRYINYNNMPAIDEVTTKITCNNDTLTYTGFNEWWNSGDTDRFKRFTYHTS